MIVETFASGYGRRRMLAFVDVVSPFTDVCLPAQYLAGAESHATTIQ
jgi:hypothetical protein